MAEYMDVTVVWVELSATMEPTRQPVLALGVRPHQLQHLLPILPQNLPKHPKKLVRQQ